MFTKTVCNISKCRKLSAASRALHFNCHPLNQASYVELVVARSLHDLVFPVFYASDVRIHITLHTHVDARLHMKSIHAYRAVIRIFVERPIFNIEIFGHLYKVVLLWRQPSLWHEKLCSEELLDLVHDYLCYYN